MSVIDNSRQRAEIMYRRKLVDEAVRTMSSTYRSKKAISVTRQKINREVSDLASTKLREVM